MTIITGLDIETTGLLTPDHRIIEVAAVLYNLETGEQKGRWLQRVNPERPVEAKALDVHGITFEEVAHCPKFDSVADRLLKILRVSNYVVAHNGEEFDLPFIEQELRRVGRVMPPVRVIDTMKQARWATPLGKHPTLGELCFACRVPYDPSKAHGALYDVTVMMESFFHAYKRGFFSLEQETQDAVSPHSTLSHAA